MHEARPVLHMLHNRTHWAPPFRLKVRQRFCVQVADIVGTFQNRSENRAPELCCKGASEGSMAWRRAQPLAVYSGQGPGRVRKPMFLVQKVEAKRVRYGKWGHAVVCSFIRLSTAICCPPVAPHPCKASAPKPRTAMIDRPISDEEEEEGQWKAAGSQEQIFKDLDRLYMNDTINPFLQHKDTRAAMLDILMVPPLPPPGALFPPTSGAVFGLFAAFCTTSDDSHPFASSQTHIFRWCLRCLELFPMMPTRNAAPA